MKAWLKKLFKQPDYSTWTEAQLTNKLTKDIAFDGAWAGLGVFLIFTNVLSAIAALVTGTVPTLIFSLIFIALWVFIVVTRVEQAKRFINLITENAQAYQEVTDSLFKVFGISKDGEEGIVTPATVRKKWGGKYGVVIEDPAVREVDDETKWGPGVLK